MVPRKIFEEELEKITQDIIKMGADLELALSKTVTSITTGNRMLAEEVMENDDYFDLLEVEIEKRCVSLIIHQQPIAKDLRFVMSILKIVTDMERIADQCEDICKYLLQMDEDENADSPYKRHIVRMAERVEKMLNRTIDSFVQKDVEKLREICKYDDKIDEAFTTIWGELVEEMNKSADFAKKGAGYIMIIKYFERIADHVTNIAEWLIYNITGEYAR